MANIMSNKKLKEALTVVLNCEHTKTSEDEMVKILQSNYTQEEINYILKRLHIALSMIESA